MLLASAVVALSAEVKECFRIFCNFSWNGKRI